MAWYQVIPLTGLQFHGHKILAHPWHDSKIILSKGYNIMTKNLSLSLAWLQNSTRRRVAISWPLILAYRWHDCKILPVGRLYYHDHILYPIHGMITWSAGFKNIVTSQEPTWVRWQPVLATLENVSKVTITRPSWAWWHSAIATLDRVSIATIKDHLGQDGFRY